MPLEQALEQVQSLVADGVRLKDASRKVSASTGLSAKALYDAAVSAR